MLIPVVLLGVLLLGGALLVGINLRRRWLSREGGAIEMSFRLRDKTHGRGWVLGVGRFVGDELQWFRVFSISPRPRRTMNRRDLVVRARRAPKGPETFALLKGAEVMELKASTGPVEIAMDAAAVTGFLAWIEAQGPGPKPA